MKAAIKQKITKHPNPKNLDLSGMGINDEDLGEIMACARAHKKDILYLNLDNNHIGDKGALILQQTLNQFHRLEQISIQSNQIGREGALALFSLKKEFADLQIFFHGNKIKDVGEMANIEQLASQSIQ